LHPELGSRDLLQETINAAGKKNIKVIAYSSVGHGLPRKVLLEDKPEWALLMDDGQIQEGVRHFGGEKVSPVCSFGKYRNSILSFIKHLVDNYNIDGLYLDGPYYNWNMGTKKAVCQCEYCKAAFKSDTGYELPTNETYESSGLQDVFADWVGHRLYELLKEIVNAAKTRNLPVMFNAIAAAARPKKWEKKMLDITDGFLLEAELEGLRGMSTGNHLGKIIWRYTRNHLAWPRYSTKHIEQLDRHSGYETLMWGGAPIISYAGRLCFENSLKRPVGELFAFMKDNAELLEDTSPTKFIGIMTAQRRYAKASTLGAVYKLWQRTGVPVNIVSEMAFEQLAELRQYRLLYLTDDLEFSSSKIEVLAEYLQLGGNIIASGNFPESFLKRIFAVKNSHASELQAELENLNFWQGHWDVYLRKRNSGVLLPIDEINWIENKSCCQVLADVVKGEKSEKLAPAIVKNKIGKGTAVYINFPIERVYETTGENGLCQLLDDGLTDLNLQSLPCKISCENNLYFSFKEKDKLKLLYMCNPTTETRVFKVGIELDVGRVPEKVFSLVNGRNVNFEFYNNKVIIEGYAFEDFECLAVQY
jgi:hypothetical protein